MFIQRIRSHSTSKVFHLALVGMMFIFLVTSAPVSAAWVESGPADEKDASTPDTPSQARWVLESLTMRRIWGFTIEESAHITTDAGPFQIQHQWTKEDQMWNGQADMLEFVIPGSIDDGALADISVKGAATWTTSGLEGDWNSGLRTRLSAGIRGSNACPSAGDTVEKQQSQNQTVNLSNDHECSFVPGPWSTGFDSFAVAIAAVTWTSNSTYRYSMDVEINALYRLCVNEWDCEVRRPVFILPGILGADYDSDLDRMDWILNRGVHPETLVIDPVGRYYDDLIQTLKNVGYVEGEDLFAVAYDWRLTPGPSDGVIDGHIAGVTGDSITDDTYQFGVDYLGYHLKDAVTTWRENHPATPLDKVDIISHSTGGLVARTYLQSDAMGAEIQVEGQNYTLPEVENFIMVAVPNRGASQPWQAMRNNFIIDFPSKYIIAKWLNIAYQKVKRAHTITGYPAPITKASISNEFDNVDPELFIDQYVPTFRSLMATYDFLYDFSGDLTNLNHVPEMRNNLVLDLNNGLDIATTSPDVDPSPFADHTATTVFFAENRPTEYRVYELDYAASNVRFPLDAFAEQDVSDGIIWYRGVSEVLGDGTVPKESSMGQFIDDARVRTVRVHGSKTGHTELMSNVLVQKAILDTLGAAWLESDFSTDLAKPSRFRAIWNAIADPVELVLVDGEGRRLGYTEATGPITEIPNSVWYGELDGIGWVYGEVVPPLRVELSGLGGDYYIQVSGDQLVLTGGVESSGSLAEGQELTIDVPLTEQGGRTYLPAVLQE